MRLATTHTTNPLHAFLAYRFHFNGQEADNEVAGTGNSYTAEFWQYDSRLGRRWNVDPVPQVTMSDYSVLGNNPNIYVDPAGDFFFGLFGSTAEERRMDRANAFAKKYNGKVRVENGKPVVDIQTCELLEDGTNEITLTTHRKFGDFSSLKNFINTLKRLDYALEGSSDVANSGGEFSGVNGMYKGADLLDNVGDKLSYVPLPPVQLVAKSFSLEANVLRTIADLNSKDITAGQASANAVVRLATFGISEKVGNDIKKAGFSELKEYIFDQTSRKLMNKIEDKATVKPEQ